METLISLSILIILLYDYVRIDYKRIVHAGSCSGAYGEEAKEIILISYINKCLKHFFSSLSIVVKHYDNSTDIIIKIIIIVLKSVENIMETRTRNSISENRFDGLALLCIFMYII